MKENWIIMNKHVLFSNWLILRNCNIVKKLDVFFQNQLNKLSKLRSFKVI